MGGYHADSATTIICGGASERVERLVATTKKALEVALVNVKAGNYIGDISAAIEDVATKNGFTVVRDLFGHGVGASLHEEPVIPNYRTKQKGPKLFEGMVLAIEPMLVMGSHEVITLDDGWTVATRDGQWSAHEEHTVLVTRDGGLILTN